MGFLHPHEVEAVTLHAADQFESIGFRGYQRRLSITFCTMITRFLHSYDMEVVALQNVQRAELYNFGGIISEWCNVISTGGVLIFVTYNQMAYDMGKFALTNSSWVYGEGSVPPSIASVVRLNVGTMILGLLFMVSVGFNAAASVRVSNELGAGNPKSAAFSVVMVTAVSFVIAVMEAIVVMSLRHVISYAFTEGATVANAVSELCPFLAVSLILNGIQPVLSGVAVGCGWQAFVAYVNVGCYYVVGIPVGCLLGFKFGFGAKGIWTGMIGGTVMQTLILMWVTYRTDWGLEVEKAKKRLDKWEDSPGEPLLKNTFNTSEENE